MKNTDKMCSRRGKLATLEEIEGARDPYCTPVSACVVSGDYRRHHGLPPEPYIETAIGPIHRDRFGDYLKMVERCCQKPEVQRKIAAAFAQHTFNPPCAELQQEIAAHDLSPISERIIDLMRAARNKVADVICDAAEKNALAPPRALGFDPPAGADRFYRGIQNAVRITHT